MNKFITNFSGGFFQSDTIKSNLIDHYIPFLPMEQEHIRLCILNEFKIRNISNPTDDMIEYVFIYINVIYLL